jgi:hypothetical protein
MQEIKSSDLVGKPFNASRNRCFFSKYALEADGSLDHGFERRMRSTVSGRRLTSTEKGYLGIVDNGVRLGDHVGILFGGRMPMILRHAEESYHFIGECYMHGLMFGEALANLRNGAYKPTKFVLV